MLPLECPRTCLLLTTLPGTLSSKLPSSVAEASATTSCTVPTSCSLFSTQVPGCKPAMAPSHSKGQQRPRWDLQGPPRPGPFLHGFHALEHPCPPFTFVPSGWFSSLVSEGPFSQKAESPFLTAFHTYHPAHRHFLSPYLNLCFMVALITTT